MLTHGTLYSLHAGRALGGFLTIALSFVATARADSSRQHSRALPLSEVVVPPGGWTLRPGCGADCELLHVSGDAYELPTSVVASPTGTTYSVHHRVGADLDGNGPDPAIACFFIYHPGLPGAPDDIVNFDGVLEPIRTDLRGTVPMVTESDTALLYGRRSIIIETKSPTGTDLFPAGITQGGRPLTDACFAIGLDDALTWVGSEPKCAGGTNANETCETDADCPSGTCVDPLVSATIEFLTNNDVVAGPFDAISFFPDPWLGVVEITLPDGAGNGFNGVRLTLVTEKSIVVENDGCRGQVVAFDGDTAFSTIGATTDGPDEPTACHFFSYSDIGSDIWYRYTATCTGNLTVDLCDSDYDTKVAVYGSPTCSASRDCPVQSPPLDCNDDFGGCGIHSLVTVPVVTGQCVTIRIGGYLGFQGTGTMTLSCSIIPPPSGACCDDDGDCVGTLTEVDCLNQNGVWFLGGTCPSFTCPISPPPNDECTDCIRVETGVEYHGRTRAATGTDITTGCVVNDRFDVWNCWTADCTGRVSISTCGSSFDTSLAVYDRCPGGAIRLACDDDGCPMSPFTHSKVTLDVVEGTTYTIRVAGYNSEVGNYILLVEDCKNACCLPEGVCGHATPSACESSPLFGTSLGPGTMCGECVGGSNIGGQCVDASDCSGALCDYDLDDNGIHDSCEPCPTTTIAGAAPASGTVDSRQPNPYTSSDPRQGIGSPGGTGSVRESIIIVLRPVEPDAEECFQLCETSVDPIFGTNDIAGVTYHGAGIYELVLHHAIPAGGVTTIEYQGDGSYVEYIAHPANVDGGPFTDALDVVEHLDCCLRGLCTPTWGTYSCDINRSLLVTPADTLGVIDLMNGGPVWDAWFGVPLPTRGTCP